MTLQELKERWARPFQSDIHTKIWDEAAPDYIQKPIPNFAEDPFLKYIQSKTEIDRNTTVLDIGCGAGRYTIAIAPYVKSAVGCDLSPKMIAGAAQRSQELAINNTQFSCIDWHQADIRALDWENQFDVVFAHHTPAVSDFPTLENMIHCAKKHCFWVMNTRRKDTVLSNTLAQIEIPNLHKEKDIMVANAFMYLWLAGFTPSVSYSQEVWTMEKDTDQMIQNCINRANLVRILTKAEEDHIAQYIRSISVNDRVTESIQTTIVTLDWAI